MRNENVTPSGTPAVTNPMNNGTAEHEQKGVTMPSSAARTLPIDSLRPASKARVRAGVKKERTTPTTKTTRTRSIRTLGASSTKKAIEVPSRPRGDKPSARNVSQSAKGARRE